MTTTVEQSPLVEMALSKGAKVVEETAVVTLTPEEERLALIRQAEQEDAGDAYQVRPPRYKLVAAAQSFQHNLTEELVQSITGVVIASRITRTLWAGDEGQGDGVRTPICTSSEGRTGHVQNVDAFTELMGDSEVNPFEPIACVRCPFNQWGSGKAGRSKLCKETRRLLLMPNGAGLPAILSVPPSSVVNFDNYATGMKAKGQSYSSVQTKITATKANNPDGIAYSKVLFAPGEPLSLDDLRIAMALRKQWEAFVGEVSDEYVEE